MASNRSSVHLTLAPVVTMKVHLSPMLGSANQMAVSGTPSRPHYNSKSNTSHLCNVLDPDHKYAEHVDLEFNKLIECIEEKISDDDDDEDFVAGVSEEERECLVYPISEEEGRQELVPVNTEVIPPEPVTACKVGNRSSTSGGHLFEERGEKTKEEHQEGKETIKEKRSKNNFKSTATISGTMICLQNKTQWEDKSFNDRRAVRNHETVSIQDATPDSTQSRLFCSSSPGNQIEYPVSHSSSIVINSDRFKDEVEMSINKQSGFDSETRGRSVATTVSAVSTNPASTCSSSTQTMTSTASAAVTASSTAIVMATVPRGKLAPTIINPATARPFTTRATTTRDAASAPSTSVVMTTDQYRTPADVSIGTFDCLPPIPSSEMEFRLHFDPSPACPPTSLSSSLSPSDITKESNSTGINPSASNNKSNNRTINDIVSIPHEGLDPGNQFRKSIQTYDLQVPVPTTTSFNTNNNYYDEGSETGELGVPLLSSPEEKPMSYSSSISLFTTSPSSVDEGSSGGPMFSPFWCTLTPVAGTVQPTHQPQISTDRININSSCPLQGNQAQIHFQGPMSHTLVPNKVEQSRLVPHAVTGPVNKAAETFTTVNNCSTNNSCTTSCIHSDGPDSHTLNAKVGKSQFPQTVTGSHFVNKTADTFKTVDNCNNPAPNVITSHAVNATTTSAATTTTTVMFTSSKSPRHDIATSTSTTTTTSLATTSVESGRGCSLQGDCDRNSGRGVGGGDNQGGGCIGSTINYSPNTNCYFCKTPVRDPDKSPHSYHSDEDSGHYRINNNKNKEEFSRECPVPQEYQAQEEGTMLKSSVDLYLENVWSPSPTDHVTSDEGKPCVKDITHDAPGWKEKITSAEKMDNEDITNKGIASRFTIGKWDRLVIEADDNNNNNSNVECLWIQDKEEDDGCPTMKEFQLDNGRTLMTVVSTKKDSLEELGEQESLITSQSCYPLQSVQKTPLTNEKHLRNMVTINQSKPREIRKETEPRFEISTLNTQCAMDKKEEKPLANINLGSKLVEGNWIRKPVNSNLPKITQPKETSSVRRLTQAIESKISRNNSFSSSAADNKRVKQVDANHRFKTRRYKSDPFGLFRPEPSKARPENSEQTTLPHHLEQTAVTHHLDTISTKTNADKRHGKLLNVLSGRNENEFRQQLPKTQFDNSEQTTFRGHNDSISTGTHSENANEQLSNIFSGRNENESNKTNPHTRFRPQHSKTSLENPKQTIFTHHVDTVSTRINSENSNQGLPVNNDNESNKTNTFTQFRPQISKTRYENSEQTTFPSHHFDSIPIRTHSGKTNEQLLNVSSRRNENELTDLKTEFPVREFIIKTNEMGRSPDQNFNIIEIEEKSPVFVSHVSNSSPIPWSRGPFRSEHSQTMSDEGHVTNPERLSKSLTEKKRKEESCTVRVGERVSAFISPVSNSSAIPWSRGSSSAEHPQIMSDKGHVISLEKMSKPLTEKGADRHVSRLETDIWSQGSSSAAHHKSMSDKGHVTSSETVSKSLTERGTDPHVLRTETDSCIKNTDSETDAPIVKKTTEIRLRLSPPKTSVRLKAPVAPLSTVPPSNDNKIRNELHWKKDSVGGETGSDIGEQENDHTNKSEIDYISCVVTDADIGYTNWRAINGSSRSSSHLVVKETFISPSEDKMGLTSNCHRKPVFLSELKDEECVAGDPLILRCEVVGWPEPKLTWKFEDITLDGQEPYKSSYDGRVAVLQLPELLPTDEGTYTCRARNDAGECETKAKLTILGYAPDIYEPLDSVKARLGCPVHLQCRTKANPRPKICWSLNGQQLLDSNQHVRFSNSGDLYVMKIPHLKPEDAGCYEFRGINPFGDAMCTAYISIDDSKVQNRIEPDFKSLRPEVTTILNSLSKKMSFSDMPKTFASTQRSPVEKCHVKDAERETHLAAAKSRSSNLNLEDSKESKDLLGQSKNQCGSKDVDRHRVAITSGITTMMNRAARELESAFQGTDSEEELVVKSSLLPKSSSQVTLSSTSQILTSSGDILQTITTTMTSYDEIEDEDQLHEMMTKVENFEERKKIRNRIREIREKKLQNGIPLTTDLDEDLDADTAQEEFEAKRLANEKYANDALKEKVKRANEQKERVMQAYKDKSNITALTEDRRLQAGQECLKDRQRHADEEKKKKLELYDQLAKQSHEEKTGDDGKSEAKPAAAASTPETPSKTGDANKENIDTKEADSEKEQKVETPSTTTEGTQENGIENIEQPSAKAEDKKEDIKEPVQNEEQASDKKEDVKDSDIKNEDQISDKAEDKKEDEADKTKEGEDIKEKPEEKKVDEIETPVKEEETVEKPEEKKVEEIETPVKEEEAVEKPEEKNVEEIETPVKEEEIVEKPEEMKVEEIETPVKEAETVEKPEETKVEEIETPVKEAETVEKPEEKKVEETETPVKEEEIVEKPEEKIDEIETPVKEEETVEKPEEMKVVETETPMEEEEMLEKPEKKKVEEIETPMKEEEETLEKPEEKKVEEIESPVKEEEIVEKPEEKKVEETETPMKEEEIVEKPEEKKVDEIETPVQEEEIVEKPEEMKVVETETPMKEEETLEKPEEKKVEEIETPMKEEEETLEKPEEKKVEEIETPVKEEETVEKPEEKKVEEIETPVKEEEIVEKPEEKKVEEIETPVKEEEAVEKPEEKKVEEIETPMKEEETVEKPEEKKVEETETPMKEEETVEKTEEKKVEEIETPVQEEETVEKPEEKKVEEIETPVKEAETVEKPEEKKVEEIETPMKEEEIVEKPEEKKVEETETPVKEEETVEKPEEKNEGTTEKMNGVHLNGEKVDEKLEAKKDASAEKGKEEAKTEDTSEDKKDGAVEKAKEDDGTPKETTETSSVTSKDGKTTTVTTVQTITDKTETRIITTEVTTKTMADGGTSTKTSKRTKIIQNQAGPGGAMAAPGGLAPGGRGRGVTRSPSAIKQMLLEWTKAMTQEYSDKILITNFSSSWNNGLAFCALIHHFYPDSFDFDALDPKKRRYNFDLAFDTAEKVADIAPLLDTDDMVRMKNPDWKCVFTYVQSFYRKLQSHERNKALPKPQAS